MRRTSSLLWSSTALVALVAFASPAAAQQAALLARWTHGGGSLVLEGPSRVAEKLGLRARDSGKTTREVRDDFLPAVAIRWPEETFRVPPPRPKFRHRWWLHVTLFLVTLLFTTVVGAIHYDGFITEFGRRDGGVQSFTDLFRWTQLKSGLWYSLTLLGILGAHEDGLRGRAAQTKFDH